ncbi:MULTISPECIES: acetylornithine deacetylase [Ralstonia solanacearum species complex]|uniref:Acetylornithine deacetylase n=1 Tax=Ralstonia solanacearum K60 TaxID=1091042 RepID=A0AAP7ZR83_RALSL|nr:acetylornithine deacetylase [Ralstonia solanacearum]OYQ14882.1 acetylornithine deacetylase [Ralstonia solanacearum K60]CCF95927.1 Acetylornithine deacetylase [Ralstonia solanacearum K60]
MSTATTALSTLDWTRKLVGFDTTSRGSNLALIETVRDHLHGLGLETHLSYNDDRNKANLFATIPAADGGMQGGIVLSGHTDVVPVDGQHWSSDPFVPEVRDGRLYGRGTCDMKGFIAASLALVPSVLRTRLREPIHLALSYDEEVGCVGAPRMLEDLIARGIRPAGCIVGEPTSMRPIVAHKGINAYRCRVHGRAAHSSLTPQGVNAIEYAARIICFVRDMADEFRARGPFDAAFDVPFTTASTGLIHGGIALNTIPALCEFVFEFRNLPGIDAPAIRARVEHYVRETIEPAMRREHPDARIELDEIAAAPSLDASEQAAITQLVRALTEDNDQRKVAYGTEAGLFQRAGIPAILCGPGNIEQAHKANEYVELAQLDACDRFLAKVARSLMLEPASA